eukprot:601773-Rhodomonas_salina.2
MRSTGSPQPPAGTGSAGLSIVNKARGTTQVVFVCHGNGASGVCARVVRKERGPAFERGEARAVGGWKRGAGYLALDAQPTGPRPAKPGPRSVSSKHIPAACMGCGLENEGERRGWAGERP